MLTCSFGFYIPIYFLDFYICMLFYILLELKNYIGMLFYILLELKNYIGMLFYILLELYLGEVETSLAFINTK